jgi:hypothetical protein
MVDFGVNRPKSAVKFKKAKKRYTLYLQRKTMFIFIKKERTVRAEPFFLF